MNRRVTALALSAVLSLGLISGCGKSVPSGSGEIEKDSSKPAAVQKVDKGFWEGDRLQYVYDIGVMDEKWAETVYDADIGWTYAKLLSERVYNDIGTLGQPLSVRPVGFTEYVEIRPEDAPSALGEWVYKISVKENNFLYPVVLKPIDDETNNVSAQLRFGVIGSDFMIHYVDLEVIDHPSHNAYYDGAEVKEGEWTFFDAGQDGAHTYMGLYGVHDEKCISLRFLETAYDDDYLKANKDYYEGQLFKTARAKETEELVKKVVDLISIEHVDLDSESYDDVSGGGLTMSLKTVELDDHTTLHLDRHYIRSWSSGDEDAAWWSEGNSIISFFDHEGSPIVVEEMSNCETEEDWKSLYDHMEYIVTPYSYNGRDLWVVDPNMGTDVGIEIVFEAGGRYYSVSSLREPDSFDANDIDSQISWLLSDIVEFH